MYNNYFQNTNSPMDLEAFNEEPMYNGNPNSPMPFISSAPSGNMSSTVTITPSSPNGNISSDITTTPSRPGGNIDSTITTTPSRPGGNIDSTITTTPSRPGGNIDSTITVTPSRPGGNISSNIINWPTNFQIPSPPARPANTIPAVLQSCIDGLVYVWLRNGENFWMIPNEIYENAVYGYQWDNVSGWFPTGLYLSDIISATCIS